MAVLLNTPGDVEMLPLALITLLGVLGGILFLTAPLKRYFETLSFKKKARATIIEYAESGGTE